MLKIRTLLSLVVLALMLMTTYQFVAARTEVISNPSFDPATVISNHAGSPNPFVVAGPSYPTKFDECIDMPGVVGSVVACPNPGQIPAPIEAAGSPNTSKVLAAPGPAFPSSPIECIDMPGVVGSVVACPNPGQIPAPEWWIKAHSGSK
jgi:hypothetical protein